MADKYSSHGGYTIINVASAMLDLLIANDAPDHQAATKPGYYLRSHGNALMTLARAPLPPPKRIATGYLKTVLRDRTEAHIQVHVRPMC
jgi:hypothetical protein